MEYKLTFRMNVLLAVYFAIMASFLSNPQFSKNPSIYFYFFYNFLALAPIFSAIAIKKNNRKRINLLATVLNYVNIPILFYAIVMESKFIVLLYLALPTAINLIALRAIKNKSEDDFENYKIALFNFVKSIFR
jgi:hypothetical protein